MAHLAAQDTAAAQLLAGEPPGELDEYRETLGDAELTVDGFNAFVVNRRSGLAYRRVLTDWGRAADALLAFASRITDEEWKTRTIPWLAGEIGVRYVIQSRIVEWWIHGEDVRSSAEMPPRVEHRPIFLTNDLAIRMLPWALYRAGLDFPGRSIGIDLVGAGGSSWHWSLEPKEVPGEYHKPDAFVEGRSVSFALVAACRRTADEFLHEGSLVVGGDEQIALAVLEHVRAYP